MSYNYAYDAVQRSKDQNMFASSSATNVQNGVAQGPRAITVASGANYNLSAADLAALFPTSGVYSLNLDSAGTSDLSAVGRATIQSDGTYIVTGFVSLCAISGAGLATYAQMVMAGSPSTTITIQQNTGANIVYSATSTKLSN